MKKKIVFLVALALMVLCAVLPIAVFAADTDPTLTVNTAAITTGEIDTSSAETCQTKVVDANTVFSVGDTFYVPVILSNMASFDSVGLQMTYNSEILEFTGIATSFSYTIPDYGITTDVAKTMIFGKDATVNPDEAKVIVYSSSAIENAENTYGYLFFAGFKVIGKSVTGKTEIGIQSAGEYQGITMTGVTYDSINYVSGTINVEKDEIASALSFKDGETTYDFATLKADDYTLTAPGVGYHFAGWFSGLTEDADGMITLVDGRYILSDKATPDDTLFENVVECRPKYDEAPESGTYNALWIHEDNAETFSAMALEVYENSFKYRKQTYTQAADEVLSSNEAIRKAWTGANGNGRVKLVKNLNVYGITGRDAAGELNYIGISLKLDMNGRTLTGVETSYSAGEPILEIRSGTSGNVIESSRGQGTIKQLYHGTASYSTSYAFEADQAQLDVIRDVDFVSENPNASGNVGMQVGRCTIGRIERVNVSVSTTGEGANLNKTTAIRSSNTASKATSIGVMNDCTVASNGYLIYADKKLSDFGTITNCTMTATGTAITSPIYLEGGKIAFGAGNTVTAESSGLFRGAPEINFTSAGSTYQCAESGDVLGADVKVTGTPVAGTTAISENGKLVFVSGFTLKFYNYDGTQLLGADRYLTGETPVDHEVTYDIVGLTTYEHLGWATEMNGEPVDVTALQADTTLYAIREEVTLDPVVSISVDGGEPVDYATWDGATATLGIKLADKKVLIKLLADAEGSGSIKGGYSQITLDLNGYTLTYTGTSSELYNYSGNFYTSSFTLTSSAAQKGTVILAEGAKGLAFTSASFGTVEAVVISNVRVEAPYLAANTGWNSAGAVITIINQSKNRTETLTMTDVEIVAANCPAVEFSIASTNDTCKIDAEFKNVKLSGNPVAVGSKGSGTPGATHVNLTVDAASTFKGAEGIYPIQVTNGNFGLTLSCKDSAPTADGELHDKDGDGWYSFAHFCSFNSEHICTTCGKVEEFTITWIVNGETTTETYEYGAMPSFKDSTDKAADAQYTYTFNGWSPVIAAVTGNATYTAQYSTTTNTYTITFVDEDGTVLQSSEVAYGETPVYTGATPTKAATAQYTYTFNGWDNEVVAVTGEATYTAQYDSTVNKYTIKFVNEDGTELQSSEVAYGETPEYNGETPTKAADANKHYTFTGWDKEIATVTGDATYKAIFEGADHTDAPDDGNHTCDECGAENATACGDSEKDHICDTDSACTAYSTGDNAHADGEDANHTCDYCNGAVEGEECVDANNDGDHNCDECGKADVTEHTYADATCTTPKTCTECGNTDGKKLGHVYDDNADATCNRCGVERDLMCNHTYDEDGCDEAYRWKQCSKCQAVDESTKVERKYTVTFQGFANGKDITLQGTYGISDTVTVPTLKSFYFEFEGAWTVDGQVLTPDSKVELRALKSLIGEEDTIYVRGTYAITGLKPDAVAMSMQYGDTSDVVNDDVFMTISVFVTVDKGMTPIVNIGGADVEGERVGTLDVYYYQIPLTMAQIMNEAYELIIKVGYEGSGYTQELTVSIAEYIRALTDMFGEEGAGKTEELFEATRNYIEALQVFNSFMDSESEELLPESAPTFTVDENNIGAKDFGEATMNGNQAIAQLAQANVSVNEKSYALVYRFLINLPEGMTLKNAQLILTDNVDDLDRTQKWDGTVGTCYGDYEQVTDEGVTYNQVWVRNVPASEMAVRYATIYLVYRDDQNNEYFAYSTTKQYGVTTYLNREISRIQNESGYADNHEDWLKLSMYDALRTLAGLADPLNFDDSTTGETTD